MDSMDDDATRFGDLKELMERIVSFRPSREEAISTQIIIYA